VTFGWLSRLALAASVGLVTTVVYKDGFVSPMIENAHDDEIVNRSAKSLRVRNHHQIDV
jgi:hypothetical protein